MLEKKWVLPGKIKLFKRTANCYKAIGIEARHYDNRKPPSNPISYSDAKKLVDKINLEWLKERNE